MEEIEEPTKQIDTDDDNHINNTNQHFFEALNEFPPSVLDPLSNLDAKYEEEEEEEEVKSSFSIPQSDPLEDTGDRGGGSNDSVKEECNENSSNSQVSFTEVPEMTPTQRKNNILSILKDHKRLNEAPQLSSISGETLMNQETVVTASKIGVSHFDDLNGSSSSILVLLAGLAIKAVGMQMSLLFKFFSFPIWVSYSFFLFMVDPFAILKRILKRINDQFMKLWGVFYETFAAKLNRYKFLGKLVVNFGWGLLWSIYVWFVLFGFLISSFIIGAITVRYLVEEPIRMTESLNFDYTKFSPVALVPIASCPSLSCGVDCKENVGVLIGGIRRFPSNHKLELTISLTLPESEYNRRIGVFQVRVDFLSKKGEVTASLRHPCMLRFKSHVIQDLETLLKSVPLLVGYSSETQVLTIKMKGFSERYRPTSCLTVVLEQRAEYKSGAGIPEIYAASLILKSELPLFQKFLWNWKRTVYIWISMGLFVMELILVLLCCRPILIPRARCQDGSTNINNQGSTKTLVVNRASGGPKRIFISQNWKI